MSVFVRTNWCTFGVVSAELWDVGEGLAGTDAGFTSC